MSKAQNEKTPESKVRLAHKEYVEIAEDKKNVGTKKSVMAIFLPAIHNVYTNIPSLPDGSGNVESILKPFL
jgi:hypothetical protein